jgi:hypothetical protein
MSNQGQTFLQTIEADFQGAVGWFESEAAAFANAAWTDIKQIFHAATAEQVTIIKALVAEAESDIGADDDVAVTAADVLNLAEEKELAWLTSLPNQVLESLIGLFRTKFGD